MNILDIKDGDTLLVTNHKSFVSRTIVKVMRHWGKKLVKRGIYTQEQVDSLHIQSHAARLFWDRGLLYVYGSIDSGYKPWLFERHYNWATSDFTIMRRKTPLTSTEAAVSFHFAQHLVAISLGYQFVNFLQWLATVYLGIRGFNTRKDDNDKFEYCYESEREHRKHLNPEWYGNVDQTDIYDLMLDPHYEIIYQSKI